MARLHFADKGTPSPLWVSSPRPSPTPQGNRLYDAFWVDGGSPAPFLYKEYPDGEGGHLERLKLFDAWLATKPELRRRLWGIPLGVVTNPDTNGHGVIMRRIDGVPLREFRALPTLSLKPRLELAIDLTLSVAILHGNDVVHTDLTTANILVDMDGIEPKVNLIDLDLAAVRNRSSWRAGLEPRVAPGMDNPSWAPEQLNRHHSARTEPTVWTDRWALAVALHRLLLAPQYLNVLHEPLNIQQYAHGSASYTGPHQWPAPERESERPQVTTHRRRLKMIGPELGQFFVSVFNQVDGRDKRRRPTATRWLRALIRARGKAGICQNSQCVDLEFGVIALDGKCPLCGWDIEAD